MREERKRQENGSVQPQKNVMRERNETPFSLRHARPQDEQEILAIYARARQFMAETGNPRQWNSTWPPEKLVREDIRLGRSFVCVCEGQVEAVFVCLYGQDIEPTYRQIEGGSWQDPGPYAVIHRLAVSGRVRHAGAFCVRAVLERYGHLRVDTHPDNAPMQHLLQTLGFAQRGIIHVVEDDDPRLAYELSLAPQGEGAAVPSSCQN